MSKYHPWSVNAVVIQAGTNNAKLQKCPFFFCKWRNPQKMHHQTNKGPPEETKNFTLNGFIAHPRQSNVQSTGSCFIRRETWASSGSYFPSFSNHVQARFVALYVSKVSSSRPAPKMYNSYQQNATVPTTKTISVWTTQTPPFGGHKPSKKKYQSFVVFVKFNRRLLCIRQEDQTLNRSHTQSKTSMIML